MVKSIVVIARCECEPPADVLYLWQAHSRCYQKLQQE